MSEPAEYHMYSEKSLTWNGITQQNRNGLLWDKTLHVDGLKPGTPPRPASTSSPPPPKEIAA